MKGLGLKVRKVHADVGLPGSSGTHRPAGEDALQDLRDGEVQTLVVWKLVAP